MDLLATAERIHERTGLYVTQVHSRTMEPFGFAMGCVSAACFCGAESDVIVTEDGRRWDADGEETE